MADGNNNRGKVSQFFAGRSIFITGATGFMGKVLVHKLLDSCPEIDKVYVLIRPKRGVEPQERLFKDLLQAPIFKEWQNEENSGILGKIQAFSGDITLPGLGLSSQDTATVVNNVSVIFHSAATVRFDEDLTKSVLMNIEGTQSIIELAQKTLHLKAFVHVSSAYAHCTRPLIKEHFYNDEAMDAAELIDMCKKGDAQKLNSPEETKKLIGKHPNTYTFTKAVTEHLLQQHASDLPLVIFRPSIVVAAWKSPIPGWIDNYNGPTGIIAGAGTGILRSMMVSREKVADIIPVDVAINVMIVSAWKMGTSQDPIGMPIPIYNCTSGSVNPITWGNIEVWALESIMKYPMESIVWYPGGAFKRYTLHDLFCRCLFLYLPALVVDIFLRITRKPVFATRLACKMTKVMSVLQYFSTKQWTWTADNLDKLHCELEAAGEDSLASFDFDIKSLDWRQFFDNYVLGTRHFVLKNKPDSIEASKKKLKSCYLLHLSVQLIFVLFISFLLSGFYGL